MAEFRFDEAACLPGIAPVVGGIGREQRGAFDAADAGGRDEQVLGVAVDVFQDGEAGVGIDFDAFLRDGCAEGGWLAGIVDDLPEGVGVGGAGC
jgi:hypothetical protein